MNKRCFRWGLPVFALVLLLSCKSKSPTPPAENIEFVNVKDNFFEPESITVNPGTHVRWTWVGIEPHTVTNGVGYSDSTLGLVFDSGTHLNGFVFDFNFDSLGSFPYFCTEHGPVTMPGFVKVE